MNYRIWIEEVLFGLINISKTDLDQMSKSEYYFKLKIAVRTFAQTMRREAASKQMGI